MATVPDASDVKLRYPTSDSDVAIVRQLFMDYQEWLDVDLCFQGFEAELNSLPEPYVPSGGRIIVAERESTIVGCVAVRGLKADQHGQDGDCEMKRLYVVPSARGLGLGRLLAEAVIEEAGSLGYSRMVLDTLPRLEAAIALYRELGFLEIPEYYHNPVEGVIFMAKTL